MESSDVGRLGEGIAAGYLVKRGYKILARNWRSRRWGEIDIVAEHQNRLVFIEVKTRSTKSVGEPFESINYYKVRSLLRTAKIFKAENPNTPEQLSLDAISIVLSSPPDIEYFENIYQEI
jgi:putative endonuclease